MEPKQRGRGTTGPIGRAGVVEIRVGTIRARKAGGAPRAGGQREYTHFFPTTTETRQHGLGRPEARSGGSPCGSSAWAKPWRTPQRGGVSVPKPLGAGRWADEIPSFRQPVKHRSRHDLREGEIARKRIRPSVQRLAGNQAGSADRMVLPDSDLHWSRISQSRRRVSHCKIDGRTKQHHDAPISPNQNDGVA